MLKLLLPLLLLLTLTAEEKFTTHSIELNGKRLDYTATVGTGEVSYIAYIKEGENRPITFAFNGGPGSSSVWLHLGALGPRRVITHEEGQPLYPPYKIIDNMETLLDLSDLVFIDPMGTGLSQAESEEAAKKHYSMKGDVAAVGKFIRNYLTQNQRWNSPKFLMGESYGATRAAGLAEYLPEEFGIFLNGILFISPAIDFQTFLFHEDNPLPYFLYLPTYAATAWHYGKAGSGSTLEETVAKAREFAYKTYAPSLLNPKEHDLNFISEEIAKITGLPLDLVRLHRGKIDEDIFLRSLLYQERKMVGRFDSRESNHLISINQDPSEAVVSGIFSGALHDYLHKELGMVSSYTILSMDVNRQWNYSDWCQFGYPSLMNALRNGLAANPKTKFFVGCGYFDLATPLATAEYCFEHLGIPDASIQIEYYDAGHMFYTKPSARKKFKQDLIQFYENAL
jgi:carboxypeptidase C (cathepsin A)